MSEVLAANPPDRPVDADVPCVGCRYNLRTLPRDGVCPECGRRVDESVWRYEVGSGELGDLRLNTIPWRNAMCQGLLLAAIAWGLQFCGVAFSMIWQRGFDLLENRSIVWLQLPAVCTLVVSYWSAWVLVTPRQGVLRTRLTRCAIVIGIAAMGLILFSDHVTSPYSRNYLGPPDNPPLALRVFNSIARGATAAWPVVTVLTFIRLVYLAWLSDHRVAGVLLGVFGFITSGFMVWIAVLVNVFRITTSGSDILPSLVGPTGTNTVLWEGAVLFIREVPQVFRHVTLFSWELLWITILFGFVGMALAIGPFYWRIRSTITRSIRLSESLDPSCPTSPSPRPPGRSR